MSIVVAGGSGFLGRALTIRLRAAGHEVIVLTRSASGRPAADDGIKYLEWDPDGSIGEWARVIEGVDAVINLTGAGIADRRWNADRKAELRSSRTESTRSLSTAFRIATNRPPVFVQISGVGFYGATLGAKEIDESFPPGADFLSDLCVAWEAEAHPIEAMGVRVTIVRSGLVFAGDGGSLPQMAEPFKWFVGGPLGSGRQYVPWIHRDDWTNLMLWAISTPTVSGVVNAVAPGGVTNKELSQAIGRALRRPSVLPVPGFALKAIVGELATSGLLKGQHVVPTRTLDLGFRFTHPTIDEALSSIYGTRESQVSAATR